MKRKLLFLCVIFMSLFVIGCRPEDDPAPYQSNPILENVDISPRALTGQVTGTAAAVYNLSSGKVTCNDDAADYQLMLAKDNILPNDTLLSGPLPSATAYFRLDIYAVMRMLDEGKCLQRDPSDDRVHLKVEGYYEGSNYKFTTLSCSSASSPSNAEIYHTAETVVSGSLECVFSDQMKYTFRFSDLKLK
jgi:hypothetical protein